MGEQDFTTSLESAKTKSRSRENKEENMTKGIKTVLTVAVIITCTGGKNLAADSIVTEGVAAAIDGAVATLTVDGSVDAIVIDAVAQTRIASIEVVFA